MKTDLKKLNCRVLSDREVSDVEGGFLPFLVAAGFILLGTCGCHCNRMKIVVNTYDLDHSSMSDSDSVSVSPRIDVPLHFK